MYKLLVITIYGGDMCQNVIEYDSSSNADFAYDVLKDTKIVNIRVIKLYK